MRVTDSMFFNNMQRNIALRQSDYADAQEQAVSGLKVSKPSDDPLAYAQARTETGRLNRAKSYDRTIDTAKTSLSVSDNTLTEVDNVMQSIRDVAVQGSNDTLNPNDRNTLSQQLESLKDQLVSLGNTVADGRFVFGGYKDDVPPYDPTGAYTGDPNTQSVEVSPGVNLAMGVTGDKVFGASGASGDDIFATITKMQTALSSGASSDLSGLITDVDGHMDTMRTAHSQIGLQLNAADIASTVAGRAEDSATTSHSNLVDIDAAQAYTNLARMQTALQAAIQIAGQLPPPGLVDRSR
jgi:flagellar hook-associated protein 3 FlgL